MLIAGHLSVSSPFQNGRRPVPVKFSTFSTSANAGSYADFDSGDAQRRGVGMPQERPLPSSPAGRRVHGRGEEREGAAGA
jgi:hypothetical protein